MTDRRYELLPGWENQESKRFNLGEAANSFIPQFGYGAVEGLLGLANMARPGTYRPDINVFGRLPEPGQPNMPAPEPTDASGRVGRGVGNAAPYVGLLAPMAGPAAALEAGIGLLGATAGETAREYGAGGLGQFLADLGMSMTPGLLAQSVLGTGATTLGKNVGKKATKRTSLSAQEAARIEKPMLATHNTYQKNLLRADELGGFPAPSIGIVNPFDNGMHDANFGDVTLVGTRDLVDPANTPVYPTDAFTVRYPTDEIRYQYTDKQNYVRAKMWGEILEDPNIHPDVIQQTTPIKTTKNGELVDNLTARILFYKEKGWPLPSFGEADHPLAFRDKMTRVSSFTTDQGAYREYLKFRKAFGKKHKLEQRAMIPNAKGRYMPVTLKRITSRMKRKPKDIPGSESSTGLADEYGVSGLRAHAVKPFESFDELDKARGNLQWDNKEYYARTAEEFKNATGAIASQGLFPDPLGPKTALARYAKTGELVDGMKKPFSAKYVKEQADRVIASLREGPSPYFEAKPMRPVSFEEFKAALVPEGAKKEVIEALERRGLKVKQYRTENDRTQLMAEQTDLFFQYLAALAGGGAAVGAASQAVQGEEPPQLLRAF